MSGYFNSQALDGPGLQGVISVGTTPILLKVGATVLAERKIVSIQPEGNKVYFGYTSGVTTSTGTRVFKDQIIQLEATSSLDIYLVSDKGSGISVRITEVS